MKAHYSVAVGHWFVEQENDDGTNWRPVAKVFRGSDDKELAYEFAAAKDMRKALQDLMDDCNAVSSYCEYCEKHAPVDNDTGIPTGPIQHAADCSYGNAERALAKAAGTDQ